MGEHIDWALLRPDMAAGMGKLSAAVYGNSELSVRERESARWTIALINDCAVCRDTRARDGEAVGAGEPFYAEVTDWRAATELSTRERLAAEFAERFAIPNRHGSYEALVLDPEVDVVYLMTPNELHCRQAIAAADHGEANAVTDQALDFAGEIEPQQRHQR